MPYPVLPPEPPAVIRPVESAEGMPSEPTVRPTPTVRPLLTLDAPPSRESSVAAHVAPAPRSAVPPSHAAIARPPAPESLRQFKDSTPVASPAQAVKLERDHAVYDLHSPRSRAMPAATPEGPPGAPSENLAQGVTPSPTTPQGPVEEDPFQDIPPLGPEEDAPPGQTPNEPPRPDGPDGPTGLEGPEGTDVKDGAEGDGASPPEVAPPPSPRPNQPDNRDRLDLAPDVPAPAPVPEAILNPNLPPGITGSLEVTADQQEYDERRRVAIATGNAVLRYQGSVINAERIQINLNSRIALAEGDVALTRGQQVLRGDRLEYNLVQGDGAIQGAYGEIDRTTAGPDLVPGSPVPGAANADGSVPPGTVPDAYNPALDRPLSDRISANEPIDNVVLAGQFGLELGTGNFGLLEPAPGQTGEVNRFRFQADDLDFDPNGWTATNARITNDPFSPPEAEIRAERLRFRRLSPLRDEVVAERGKIVLDNRFTLPLLARRTVIDRRERPPEPFRIGYDGRDRDGLFIEKDFELIRRPGLRLRFTPQYYVQRVVSGIADSPVDPHAFGFKSRLSAQLTPLTSLVGVAQFTSLDLDRAEDNFRGSLRLSQVIPTGLGPHRLTLEQSYRDRLFNGAFGFQTVQSSLGAIFESPPIRLGRSGILLNYQAGWQRITARTDRLEFLEPGETRTETTLNRTQGAITLQRGFLLWRGRPLPATREEGLRYTPSPVVPSISLSTRVRGVLADYSNGDQQNYFDALIGIQGNFGHFSRPFLDYTAFNVAYVQRWRDGDSPFLFDRVGENQVLVVGLTQQLAGPVRIGGQIVYSIDREEIIDSSFTLEYSRRTYGLILRVRPEREAASLILRISDFNWTGSGEVFDN